MVKIGINGFGRIGRLILRALLENYKDKIQVVGINDLGSIETNAHLIKYDSTHGTLPQDVSTSKDGFKILNQNIKVFAERDPANLPWGKVGADVVLECTGLFLNKETAGIAYESCCWATRLVHFKEVSGSSHSYSTGIELVFKGLGSTSSSIRKHVENNIPYYRADLGE